MQRAFQISMCVTIGSIALFGCESKPTAHATPQNEQAPTAAVATEQPTAVTEVATEAVHEHDRPGFVTSVEDDRLLWVWPDGAEREKPVKQVRLVGAGPDGLTIVAPDQETATRYLATKPGYQIDLAENRLWVWRDDQQPEKTAKQVRMVAAGPRGTTLVGQDRQTLVDYLTAADGFVTEVDEDGRLWVWSEGEEQGKPAKQVRMVGAGPMGLTLVSPARDTLEGYLAAVGR
ncbi:MAG: hypothetical protein WD294_17075 [Phycisphaeraceae bacterium]